MRPSSNIAVIGGGWAGLAAAIEAAAQGHAVTLFEMAPHCGGRARCVEFGGLRLDNGQHIMIGAYKQVLRLMARVGADCERSFLRTPLAFVDPAGDGLELRPGLAATSFLMAVARHRKWGWPAKFALLTAAIQWALAGFRCNASLDVASLTRHLPAPLRDELIDPLCLAALNTPAAQASAAVFLRVVRDTLFSGAGSSDLLLPRADLGSVFPEPALRWLEREGATVHLCTRVNSVQADNDAWCIDGMKFARVVIATPPAEAARLASPIAPRWAAIAQAMNFEPIVTVYLRSPGTRLAAPMVALRSDSARPAQFVFDRGQLGGPEGLLAFVISGAREWVSLGAQATLNSTLAQANESLASTLKSTLQPVRLLIEKRATFRCTPNLRRPAGRIAPSLWAAGDYVDGPYPATLEGAVRSGVDAIVGHG